MRRPELSTKNATLGLTRLPQRRHPEPVQQIADIFGVPRTTVYGHLDQSTVGSRPGALTTANGNGQSR